MTLLNLCELTAVKDRLSVDDPIKDTTLASIIAAVSAAIERHLDRDLFLEERTEYFNIQNPDAPINLRAYPVTVVTSIKNDASWDYATATAFDAEDFYIDDDSGVLYFRRKLDRGPRALEIVYTAGLANSTGALVAAYPDLAAAAEMQVTEEWIRKDSQGPVTYSLSEGGGTGQQQALMLLPAVKERLRPYRRRLL